MKDSKIEKVMSATLTSPSYQKQHITGGLNKNLVQERAALPDFRNNYLDNGFIGHILKWRHYQDAAHIITTAVFILIIYSGLTNGNDQKMIEGSVFATAFVWDVWHPLLAFTILAIGRFWCSVCPLGAIHGWISRHFSLNRRYPEKFRNVWIAVGLFIFITAAERHLFRFTRNPEATAYLLLAFLGIAVVMALIYEKRTFCRYICPTGLVLGVFSMISGSELRCKSRDVCRDHREKECLTGNSNGYGCPMYEFPQTMERNNACIYCTQCIRTCSKQNIRVSSRPFGSDLLNPKKVSLDEAFFIHSITIIMLFLMGMERTPYRNKIINFVHWVGIDRNIMAVLILTGISVASVTIMYLLHRANSPDDAKQRLVHYSYAFVPLGLSAYMAWNVFKLVRGIFFSIFETAQWAGLNVVNSHSTLDYGILNGLQILLLLAGFVFSVWIGYRLTLGAPASRPVGSGFILLVLVMSAYTIIGLWILTLPVLAIK